MVAVLHIHVLVAAAVAVAAVVYFLSYTKGIQLTNGPYSYPLIFRLKKDTLAPVTDCRTCDYT